MTWRKWQEDLSRYLKDPTPALAHTDALARSCQKQGRTPPATGLKTYRNNLVFTTLSCLKDIFPVTEAFLSAENFAFFAREYTFAEATREADIHQIGSTFAKFLAARQELTEAAWLPEVARFEWLVYDVGNKKGTDRIRFQSPFPVFDIVKTGALPAHPTPCVADIWYADGKVKTEQVNTGQ